MTEPQTPTQDLISLSLPTPQTQEPMTSSTVSKSKTWVVPLTVEMNLRSTKQELHGTKVSRLKILLTLMAQPTFQTPQPEVTLPWVTPPVTSPSSQTTQTLVSEMLAEPS